MAKLTSKERNNLPSSDFAIPSQRAYPIEDAAHARDALARVVQHGSPEQIAQVRSAVRKHYPNLMIASKDR